MRIRRLLVICLIALFTLVGISSAQDDAKPNKVEAVRVEAVKVKPLRRGCPELYTIKNYTSYAHRVYRRESISKKANLKLARIEKCQHTKRAERVVNRYHKRYLRERAWRHRGTFLGSFGGTAYGPPWGGIEGGGITATGVDLPNGVTGQPLYIIAVDPSVIPLGSHVYVWPNPHGYKGCWNAQDTGGAIKGARLDFLDMMGRSHQNNWGHRTVRVYTCRR